MLITKTRTTALLSTKVLLKFINIMNNELLTFTHNLSLLITNLTHY